MKKYLILTQALNFINMNYQPRKLYFEGGKHQGKTLATEFVLKYDLAFKINDGLPSNPYVLWYKSEEIIWLPTGEVISRKL